MSTDAEPRAGDSDAVAGGRRRLAALTATHYAGNILPMVTGLATAPLTARALGPEGRGEMAVIGTVASFLVLVGSMGFGWAARDAVATDPDSVLFWRRLSTWFALLGLPLSLGVGVAVSWSFGLATAQGAAVLLFYAAAAVATRRAVDAGVLVSLGTPHLASVANIIYAVGVMLSVVFLYLADRLDLTTVIMANMLGFLIQSVALSILVGRYVRAHRVALDVRLTEMRTDPDYRPISVFRRGWGFFRAQLVDGLATRADILLATMGGKATVGLYSVTFLLPQVAYTCFVTVVQTSFSRHPRMDPEDRLALVYRASTLLGCLLALAGCTVAYPAIPWVFGQEFAGARGFLIPAACMTLGLAGLSAVLQHIGRSPSAFWLAIVVATPMAVGLVVTTWSAAASISALGLGFAVASAAYVCAKSGRHGLRFRTGDLNALFR
jgi:O-antigen/teichoic acid export membrane protein